MPRLGN
jgi:TnpA family transposase